VWDERDPFDGEDQPPAEKTLPWAATTATVTDAFGHKETITARDGRITLAVTDTPLFVTR
jgi:hypothetical protein